MFGKNDSKDDSCYPFIKLKFTTTIYFDPLLGKLYSHYFFSPIKVNEVLIFEAAG